MTYTLETVEFWRHKAEKYESLYQQRNEEVNRLARELGETQEACKVLKAMLEAFQRVDAPKRPDNET